MLGAVQGTVTVMVAVLLFALPQELVTLTQ
jgi:hypothetical protein